MKTFVQNFGLYGGNCSWGSGTLENIISKLQDCLHGLFGELMVSYCLLHSGWQSSMPEAKYPFVTATSLQVVLTHVINYFPSQGTWFVCQDSRHGSLEV